jgi:hypothetical protein
MARSKDKYYLKELERYVKGNNGTGPKAFFEKRARYEKYTRFSIGIYLDAIGGANTEGYKNLVDFNHGEKLLYGRVDRHFVPMEVDSTKIKKFSTKLAANNAVGALNFVADAFNDLVLEFQKRTFIKAIDPADPFLSTPVVYRAYQNPQSSYTEHRRIYFNTIAGLFKKRSIKVKNFDQFIDHFLPMLERSAHRNPITRTAFIKSRRCPMGTSGLVIEIANLNPSNDQEKIDQFVNSRNWDFYVSTCAAYGFMVDRFVPWRLVADIGSSPTKSPIFDYAEKYGFKSTDDIIDNLYVPAHLNYYRVFKSDLLTLYNTVKLKSFLERQECDGGTITRTIRPTVYTPTTYYSEFSEQYFLKLYLKIRFFEEESQFSDSERNLIIDDCIEIYLLNRNVQEALDLFEKMLNKTFDYRGSLSYIVKHLKAMRGENFQDAGSDPYGY